MQLCSILKKKENHIRKKCCQLVSLLMVLVFISMNLVQAFHAHDDAVNTEQSDKGDINYTVEKCKICEFYVHKQSETTYSNCPPALIMPLPTLITHNTRHYIGNYKFTLQGFTNKGPPGLFS